MENVFNNVSKYRRLHHHNGMQFLDGTLVYSEGLHMILQKENPLRKLLKVEAAKKLQKKEKDSFTKAKNHWIAQSRKNNIQITGFIDEVLKKNEKFIYQLLNIRPIKDIIGENETQK